MCIPTQTDSRLEVFALDPEAAGYLTNLLIPILEILSVFLACRLESIISMHRL